MNHGPIGLQPIALPLSYTSTLALPAQTRATVSAGCTLASVVPPLPLPQTVMHTPTWVSLTASESHNIKCEIISSHA